MSDIARPYAPGKEPGLVAGTAASNTAGAGLPEVSGKEKATLSNQHLSVLDVKDKSR
jgi:hypothetical protein